MPSLVNVNRRGAVTRVALNRPERHNAVDRALTEALDAALGDVLADPATRVVVLAGEGRTFCSGLDLGGAGEAFRREQGAALSPFQSVVARLMESDKPIVGRVHGGAFGAGFCLMIACGVVIAEAQSRFAVTELRFGLPPTMIPLVLQHTGRLGLARHLLMTGVPFDTATAIACGLVQRALPTAALDAAVEETCAHLLACAPGAYATARDLQRRVPALTFRDGLALCGETLEAALDGEESREGLTAWREQRPARWVPPDGA